MTAKKSGAGGLGTNSRIFHGAAAVLAISSPLKNFLGVAGVDRREPPDCAALGLRSEDSAPTPATHRLDSFFYGLVAVDFVSDGIDLLRTGFDLSLHNQQASGKDCCIASDIAG